MRSLFPMLILLLLPVAPGIAQVEYQHGVLVLSDGRTLAIRGEIEVLGDEVQFTDGRGELMVLPLDRVDLDETKRRNDAIRSKSSADSPVTPDGSLFSEVTNYQLQEKKEGKKTEIVMEQVNPAPQSKRMAPSLPAADQMDLQDIPTLSIVDQEQAQQWIEKLQEKISQAPGFAWALAVAGILLAIFGLMSFIVQIYLIFIATREGFLWWAPLFVCFVGPLVLNGVGWFLGASNLIFTLGPSVLSFLSLILFPAFIIACCPGRRFRLLFYFAMVYVWAIACGIALVLWLMTTTS